MSEMKLPASVFDGLLNHPDFREGAVWRRSHYPPNTTVFSEGDTGRDVFIILKGAVRVLGNVDLDDARQIRPGFGDLGEGEVFGELALFDSQPRSAAVVTVTACDLAVVDADELMHFLDSHPEVGYPLFKDLILILVKRLRAANKKIFALFAWGLKARGIDKYL
jgi:CRP/FNR family cyclic AMP-dependent transcriptional regulator